MAGYKLFPFQTRSVVGQTSAVDLNTLTQGGIYLFLNGGFEHLNKPSGSTDGVIVVFSYTQNNVQYMIQLYCDYVSNLFYRIKWGENWKSWRKVTYS